MIAIDANLLVFDRSAPIERSADAETRRRLATLAIEHGATFVTNDRDFRVFPRSSVRFPLRDG
jgi:predicted nucleic acid-binding protein